MGFENRQDEISSLTYWVTRKMIVFCIWFFIIFAFLIIKISVI